VWDVRGGAQQDPPHQVTRDTTADRPPHRPPTPGRGSGQKGTTSLQDTQAAGGSLILGPQQSWVQGPVSTDSRGILSGWQMKQAVTTRSHVGCKPTARKGLHLSMLIKMFSSSCRSLYR